MLTVLNEALDSSETGVDVTPSLTAGNRPDKILIDDEIMDVSAGTSTLTVTRGTEGTTADSHSNTTSIYEVLRVVKRSDSLLVYYVGDNGHVAAKRIVVSGDTTESLPLTTGANENDVVAIGSQDNYVIKTPAIRIFTAADAAADLDAAASDATYIKEVSVTETAGAGTYTSTVAVKSGQRLLEVLWQTTAAFDGATAVLNVGRTGTTNAFITAKDVKAASDGVIDGAGLKGLASGGIGYKFGADSTINVTLVTTGAGGTTGRARVVLLLSRPSTAAAATKA